MIGAGVTFFAVIASLVIGLINWRQSRITYSTSLETRIDGLYDRLMDYRLKHPEVFKLSRAWTPECLSKIYTQANDEEKGWAIYVGYVELCISYCNAVLHARQRGQLDKEVYASQHQPLVKLLVTEHFPIIRQFATEGFASAAIAEFIASEQKRGWNWEKIYANMDQPADRRSGL